MADAGSGELVDNSIKKVILKAPNFPVQSFYLPTMQGWVGHLTSLTGSVTLRNFHFDTYSITELTHFDARKKAIMKCWPIPKNLWSEVLP